MRTRLVTLVAGFGLAASAAAGADVANSPVPATAPAATAAPAALAAAAARAAPAAPAARAFSGGAARFAGGGRRGGYGLIGRGSYGAVRRGGYGMASRGRGFEGTHVAAGSTRALAFARGGSRDYRFISARHDGAAPRWGAELHGPRALAPQTGSAARAVRVVEGLQRRPDRAVRPLGELKERQAAQRRAPLPGQQLECLGGGPASPPCPIPFQSNLSTFETTPAPSYFCGSFFSVHPCAPVLMPQSFCSSMSPYRLFECPQPRKMAAPR